MTWPQMIRSLALLALTAVIGGCDSEMPPQITACDQMVLEDAEQLANFLTLNTGLTCDFPPPADNARYACNTGPTIPVCGQPSEITLVGCNCVGGVVECFERQDEADQLNEMCGS